MYRIEEYFNNAAYSSRDLRSVMHSIRGFRTKQQSELFYEEKSYNIIGSMTEILFADMLLNTFEFDSLFYVDKIMQKPSDTVKSILHRTYNLVTQGEELAHAMYLSCDEHEYFMNRRKDDYTEDKRSIELFENNKVYYEMLESSGGRQIISLKEYDDSILMANALMKNNLVREVLEGKLYYQQPLFAQIEQVPLKRLPDFITSNRIWDMKTTSDRTVDFERSIKRYRYDFQVVLYYLLAQMNDMKMENPGFIVINKTDIEDIRVCTLSNNDVTTALLGDNGIYAAINKLKKVISEDLWHDFNTIHELNIHPEISTA